MTDLVWEPVKVKLGQIRPWTNNPRMSTKVQAQRIIRSWRDLGQIQTIAVGPMVDGFVDLYDGHQRVLALNTVKTPDYELLALQSNRQLTEDERKQVAVLLHTATGGWDWNALSGWSAADLREWGMEESTLKGWQADATALSNLLASERDEDEETEGAENEIVPEQYAIMITCETEEEQSGLLERFLAEGIKCRALIS